MRILRMMPLVARGSTTAGFSASPAVTPISSTPEYANITICRVSSTAPMPKGRKPPCETRLPKPAVLPKLPTWNTITASPATISATMVTTLTRANQNSSSPNTRTASRFEPYSTTSAMRAGSHCGTSGNQ